MEVRERKGRRHARGIVTWRVRERKERRHARRIAKWRSVSGRDADTHGNEIES